MSSVVVVSREHLTRRRDDLLRTIGYRTVEDLRRHADTHTLSGPESEALDEIDEIQFLLGDEA